MKKTILIVGGVLILLAIVLATYFLLMRADTSPADSANPTFPGSIDTGGGTQNTILVYARDGSTFPVSDFTKVNQPAWAGAESGFRLAGNEQAGEGGEGFQILYFPNDKYFAVGLLNEPLGENRQRAEAELFEKLKLTNEQLCALNLGVYTSIYVNEAFAGRELGLSFCPGSTKLP